MGEYLRAFLDGFDPERPLGGQRNFRPLLSLRWLIHDFINARLRLNRGWAAKRYFLELFDVDGLEVRDGVVELTGDIVWWAEGKDAAGEWWPPDHVPRPTGAYKVKIRGDLGGGFWVVEPVIAKLWEARKPGRNAGYEIEFGAGSTYMRIKSK